jgi:hypothetical protein
MAILAVGGGGWFNGAGRYGAFMAIDRYVRLARNHRCRTPNGLGKRRLGRDDHPVQPGVMRAVSHWGTFDVPPVIEKNSVSMQVRCGFSVFEIPNRWKAIP